MTTKKKESKDLRVSSQMAFSVSLGEQQIVSRRSRVSLELILGAAGKEDFDVF